MPLVEFPVVQDLFLLEVGDVVRHIPDVSPLAFHFLPPLALKKEIFNMHSIRTIISLKLRACSGIGSGAVYGGY
jgi:hypothetical protein